MALTQISTDGIKDTTIATADIADDAVTADKLANSINTEIAANTAKTTNATHTGEVTGSGALTIANDAVTGAKIADDAIDSEHITDGSIDNAHLADDAVGIAELSATGTASSSTFLRGDNSWVTPTDTNTQRAFANDANNRVVTGDGSGGLNGEANLTFDGTSLGVGTASPSGASGTALEVNGGSGQARLVLKNDTTGSGSTDGHQIYSDGNTFGIQNREAGNLVFETNGGERLRINSDGDVWQGTTSSTAKFAIVGSSAQTSATHVDTNGASLILSNTDTTDNNWQGIQFSDRTDSGDFITGILSQCTNHSSNYGDLTFWTNGSSGRSERMRINSNGVVTKPNQPCAFYVGLNNSHTNNATNNTETLVFATVKRNEGSHYDTSNGRFTAPIAGTYLVGVNILIDDNASNAARSADLQKNGSGYATLTYDRNGGDYIGMSGTGIIELAVNDHITIRGTAGIHTGGETNFWVYFLG